MTNTHTRNKVCKKCKKCRTSRKPLYEYKNFTFPTTPPPKEKCMKRPVAVVTGANRGIGFEVVKGLCKKIKDGVIYLTARDQEKGRAAVEELKKYDCHPKFYQQDITNFTHMFLFREYLIDTYDGIDILVNNAGINYEGYSNMTQFQIVHETMIVNFVYSLHFANLLLGIIRPNGRAVNIATSKSTLDVIPENIKATFLDPGVKFRLLMRFMGKYDRSAENGTLAEDGWPNCPYAMSKMAVVAMTRIQQYAIDHNTTSLTFNILINCVDPGNVKSQINNFTGNITAEEGAKPVLKLALLPKGADSPRGKFITSDLKVVDWAKNEFVEDKNLEKVRYT